MPIANYSTSIEASKTIMEIERDLSRHGAREILKNYDEDGLIESLSFIVRTPYGNMPIQLPVNPEAVLRVLEEQGVPRSLQTHAQAIRVAWRIIKDWIRAQMAILETDMVKMEQIFLPYMITGNDKTLYESMVDNKFYLTEGK